MEEVKIISSGLENDRTCMLMDETGNAITQRQFPELTRFKVNLDGPIWEVMDAISKEKIYIHPQEKGGRFSGEIWGDSLDFQELDPSYSAWFSKILKRKLKLVRIHPENTRLLSAKNQGDFSKSLQLVDGMPVSIVSRASLENFEKIYGPYNWLRFRPNFIVEADYPHQEDEWKKIKIGEVEFESKKLCKRCALTTIDPETGERDSEFLTKLAQYRKMDQAIYFANQFIPLNQGFIKKGDLVHV